MPDWLVHCGRPFALPIDPVDAAPLVLCRDVADGLKHFVKKIPGTAGREGAFASAFDAGAYDTDNLWIYPNAEEAAMLGVASITAIDLERRLIAYWERFFATFQP